MRVLNMSWKQKSHPFQDGFKHIKYGSVVK